MEKSNVVFRTSNYKQFKRLDGNRRVPIRRVNKIKQSISEVGYIQSPIIVNEKMEIIDGQGRVAALESLRIPIDYIVVKGIGIKECRSMNINQSNWTMMDFVESYAEEGNESYIYFQNLMKAYKGMGIVAVNNAVTGLSATNNDAIKSGRFVCTKDDYEKAVKILDYERRFTDIVRKIKGRADYIYIAIGFCYQSECVDNELLFQKMNDKYDYIQSGSWFCSFRRDNTIVQTYVLIVKREIKGSMAVGQRMKERVVCFEKRDSKTGPKYQKRDM